MAVYRSIWLSAITDGTRDAFHDCTLYYAFWQYTFLQLCTFIASEYFRSLSPFYCWICCCSSHYWNHRSTGRVHSNIYVSVVQSHYVATSSKIRHEDFRLSSFVLRPSCVKLTVPPPWILKQGELESSGQRLIWQN